MFSILTHKSLIIGFEYSPPPPLYAWRSEDLHLTPAPKNGIGDVEPELEVVSVIFSMSVAVLDTS